MADNFLTKAGYAKLSRDLARLQNKQDHLSYDLVEIREKGDLNGSAEYVVTKENLRAIKSRIADIREKLKDAEFFDDLTIPKDTVMLGCTVTIQDQNGKEICYTLVGEDEAEPAEGRISIHAPSAQGLLCKKVGEQVRIDLAAGTRIFKILKTEPAR